MKLTYQELEEVYYGLLKKRLEYYAELESCNRDRNEGGAKFWREKLAFNESIASKIYKRQEAIKKQKGE